MEIVDRDSQCLLALEAFIDRVDKPHLRPVPVIKVLAGPYGGYIYWHMYNLRLPQSTLLTQPNTTAGPSLELVPTH